MARSHPPGGDGGYPHARPARMRCLRWPMRGGARASASIGGRESARGSRPRRSGMSCGHQRRTCAEPAPAGPFPRQACPPGPRPSSPPSAESGESPRCAADGTSCWSLRRGRDGRRISSSWKSVCELPASCRLLAAIAAIPFPLTVGGHVWADLGGAVSVPRPPPMVREVLCVFVGRCRTLPRRGARWLCGVFVWSVRLVCQLES